MTDEQADKLIILLGTLCTDVSRLANATEAMAQASAPEAPNYTRPIAEFNNFDWASIGAEVVDTDEFGPTHLDWRGYTFTRRSPQNKFGEAIWFSRPIGKDGDGNNKYARLISFKKPSEAEPLPKKVVEQVASQTPTAPTRSATPKPPAPASQPKPAPKPAPVAQRKPATIKTPTWFEAIKPVATQFPKYQQKDGTPNSSHLQMAAANEGYTEITGANLALVIQAITNRAYQEVQDDQIQPESVAA